MSRQNPGLYPVSRIRNFYFKIRIREKYPRILNTLPATRSGTRYGTVPVLGMILSPVAYRTFRGTQRPEVPSFEWAQQQLLY
jgi:hypothetical protein